MVVVTVVVAVVVAATWVVVMAVAVDVCGRYVLCNQKKSARFFCSPKCMVANLSEPNSLK